MARTDLCPEYQRSQTSMMVGYGMRDLGSSGMKTPRVAAGEETLRQLAVVPGQVGVAAAAPP